MLSDSIIIMPDNYTHADSKVIYTEESIPGPAENNAEFEELLNNYNSQLSEHCSCNFACEYPTCICLQKSGGDNYYSITTQNGQFRYYKFKSDDNTFPLIECNAECSCTSMCGNRVVQNGPIYGLEVKICEGKGYGLFTTQIISKGSFICEYAGELLTKSQALVRNKINQLNGEMNYIFCLNEYCNGQVAQTFVDPSKFGNIGRYINHSCEPNSQIIPVRCESPIPKLAIFASSDIQPGNEITFHYGPHNINNLNTSHSHVNRKPCMCKSKTCSNYMPFDNY